MNKKTKERSRTLASTLTLKEGPVDNMGKFGSGGGGGGASGLGVTQGRDKNKEEYKPDRMATAGELKTVRRTAPNYVEIKGSEVGADKQTWSQKMANQSFLEKEKQYMDEIIERPTGSARSDYLGGAIKYMRKLRQEK